MNCEASKDNIMKYFDGELGDTELNQFKQHLKSCADCRDEFGSMEKVFKALEEKTEIEPPDDFEAAVMNKVAAIEKERKEKNAKRIVWLYNAATLLSIVLLLTFVADLKQISVFSAFEKIGEYFSSFSSVAAAVAGIVRDISGLLANALLVIFDAAFSIIKSYYYIFIVLILMLFVIQKLLHFVGTYSRRET